MTSYGYGITHWGFRRKKKLQIHLPKTDKTSLHTAVNMWIRNLVIRNRVGDLQLGIESYQTKINLERPNWDAAGLITAKKSLFDCPISQEPLGYGDRNDERKLMRLNELHKAWRLGSGQRMIREEAKTSSLQSRKDYRSEGSIEGLEALLRRKIGDIDYRLITEQRDDIVITIIRKMDIIKKRQKNQSSNDKNEHDGKDSANLWPKSKNAKSQRSMKTA
ncbi:hypothetical protein Tco_0708481 [Tanacetum coccineum]